MESNTVKTDSDALEDGNVTRLPVENSREEGKEDENRPDYLRDVTEHSEKDTSVLGSDLRTARKKLGEDVQTIATALNIRAAHLEALERGDMSALPGRAYALGFVRSYASYLGLDAEASVARFKLETDRQEEEAAALAFPEANNEVHMPQGSFMLVLFLLVAAILGGLQLSRMVDSMASNAPEPPDAIAPTAAITPAPSTGTPEVIAQPITETPEEAPVAAGAEASEAEPVAAETTSASGTNPEETAAAEPAPPAAAAPAPPVDDQAFGAAPSESRVSILAKGDAWLRIDNPQSGAVVIQTTMRKGDRFFVPNEEGLVMAARNSRNLEIFVDGASVGPAGVGVLVEKSLNADLLISPAD